MRVYISNNHHNSVSQKTILMMTALILNQKKMRFLSANEMYSVIELIRQHLLPQLTLEKQVERFISTHVSTSGKRIHQLPSTDRLNGIAGKDVFYF